jgi:predicted DNA-binding transcriptional regulator YafY
MAPMNRVDRLLAEILYLQSRPLCTAEEMAGYFGLSLRTIYRDLAALGEAGVPVVAQAGVGYSLARGYHLPPVSFTTEEASALVTGGLLVERSADASVKRPMRSALMKVRAVLPRALQTQMVRLEQSMATTATPEQPAKGADLTLLQQALAQRRVLRFSYLSWGKKDSAEREVEPLGLIHYLERWHLIAWCRVRKEVRDFRTDRMSRVSMLKEIFEPRTDFMIGDYIESMPKPELRTEVLFTAPAADRARREWWLGVVAERETANGVVLTLASVDWERLKGWLLSFGGEAQVLSPESLRSQLVKAAKTAATHHQKKPKPC